MTETHYLQRVNIPKYIPPYCTPAFPSRDKLNRLYGGRIYESDFEIGYHTYMTEVDNRLKSDRKFDEQCAKNIDGREYKKRRSMGKEDSH